MLDRVAGDLGEVRDSSRVASIQRCDHRGIGIGPRHQARRARRRDFAHSSAIDVVLDAEHRRRVDRLALEDAFDQLAAAGQAEDLRQRPGRACSFPAARRRAGDRISTPCAPSPPSTFCQEKVTTSSLSQSRSCAKAARGRVADGQALAVAGIQSRIRHAHARGGAVPGEDHVVVEIDLREIGQLAIGRDELARIRASAA